MTDSQTSKNDPSVSKALDADFLAILRCPVTGSKLREDGDWLISEAGGLKFPIREGFPAMLVEEAQLPEGIASLEEFRAKFVTGKAR